MFRTVLSLIVFTLSGLALAGAAEAVGLTATQTVTRQIEVTDP